MTKEKQLFSKEKKKFPAEKIAAGIVDFANNEFNKKNDYMAALKAMFTEETKGMTSEQKEKVAKYIEGIRLYNYVSSVAEYHKETGKHPDSQHLYPESEDYVYAWSFVVPNEAKRLSQNVRGSAIFYTRVHVFADLAANILQDMGITGVENRVTNSKEQSRAIASACNEVLNHFGVHDKNERSEYLTSIKSALGKRGAGVNIAKKQKAKALKDESKKYPLFANQIK